MKGDKSASQEKLASCRMLTEHKMCLMIRGWELSDVVRILGIGIAAVLRNLITMRPGDAEHTRRTPRHAQPQSSNSGSAHFCRKSLRVLFRIQKEKRAAPTLPVQWWRSAAGKRYGTGFGGRRPSPQKDSKGMSFTGQVNLEADLRHLVGTDHHGQGTSIQNDLSACRHLRN